MSMSVPTQHTAVMLMLCVTTPGDPITALAKMDFVETEKLAEVTRAINTKFIFQIGTLNPNGINERFSFN